MRDHNGHNGYTRALGWFLAGSAAGACTGLLLAPAAGKRTRERLARKVRDTKESVTDFTDDVADTTRQIADNIADTTRHIAEKAGRIGDKAVRLAGDASAAARNVAGSLGIHTERTARR
jgi:gas vesicle protein